MARIKIPKEDFLEFVKFQLARFPRCKIDEYEDIKYNKYQQYKEVSSKQQMNTILNIKQNKIGFYHYHRLLQLLSKNIKFHDYFDLLKILKKSKFDDMQVYKFLQKHSKKKNVPTCCGGRAATVKFATDRAATSKTSSSKSSTSKTSSSKSSTSKATTSKSSKRKASGGNGENKYCSRDVLFGQVFGAIFKRFFTGSKLPISITNYLDIGCGDCKQTKVLGNAIGLPDSSIYGADISHWGGYNEEKRKHVGINIIGLKDDGILPFEDSSFCLISTFMVLHHVRPIEKLLSEIVRVLKPNGYFFIREHDAMCKIDYMLCDIEHALYDVVQRDDMGFFDTYHGIYYDWLEWDYILKGYGLKYLYGDYNSNSIYYNLTTTRSFYGIYYKCA
jgi:SAM-dependent methyltransferase